MHFPQTFQLKVKRASKVSFMLRAAVRLTPHWILLS
jgi:hypothetical protein